MNATSLWLISSLLSTILNPNKISDSSNMLNTKSSTITYFEKTTNDFIGNGSGIEQLKVLCILMILVFLFKNIFFYLSNITMNYVNNKMTIDKLKDDITLTIVNNS